MKLKDCTAKYLVKSAGSEALALGRRLDAVELSDDDRLVVNAYVGSIAARLAVAEDKLKEIA